MASPENVCFEWFELCEKEKQQDKRAHARIASIVWIGSGLYLYMTSPTVSLFSLSAIGFFLIGFFAASVAIGGAGYLLQQRIAEALTNTDVFPDPRTAFAMTVLSWLLFVAEVGANCSFARVAFDCITGT